MGTNPNPSPLKIVFFSTKQARGLELQVNQLMSLGHSVELIEDKEGTKSLTNRFDLGISDRCGFLIEPHVVAMSNYGIFNFHPSLLPKHPGSYGQFWSLIHLDYFGVTCHKVSQKLDAGPIYSQIRIPYSETETFVEVYERTRFVTQIMIWDLIWAVSTGRLEGHLYIKQARPETYHTKKSTESLISGLTKGWDTKIIDARKQLQGMMDAFGKVIG